MENRSPLLAGESSDTNNHRRDRLPVFSRMTNAIVGELERRKRSTWVASWRRPGGWWRANSVSEVVMFAPGIRSESYFSVFFLIMGELRDLSSAACLHLDGKYSEDDAKAVMVQMLNVVASCHLQGVVHRDLKPENFLFISKEDDSALKAIDFCLSDFVKPDVRGNDIVGSAYYVAPEVLYRCYSTEADVWSTGVIAYILLSAAARFGLEQLPVYVCLLSFLSFY